MGLCAPSQVLGTAFMVSAGLGMYGGSALISTCSRLADKAEHYLNTPDFSEHKPFFLDQFYRGIYRMDHVLTRADQWFAKKLNPHKDSDIEDRPTEEEFKSIYAFLGYSSDFPKF